MRCFWLLLLRLPSLIKPAGPARAQIRAFASKFRFSIHTASTVFSVTQHHEKKKVPKVKFFRQKKERVMLFFIEKQLKI